jgi:hypothetical protein
MEDMEFEEVAGFEDEEFDHLVDAPEPDVYFDN